MSPQRSILTSRARRSTDWEDATKTSESIVAVAENLGGAPVKIIREVHTRQRQRQRDDNAIKSGGAVARVSDSIEA